MDYQLFWNEMYEKVQLASNLYDNKALSGLGSLKYSVQPVVSEEIISDFELKYQIKLPVAYRTYLKYFGSNASNSGNTVKAYLSRFISRTKKTKNYLCVGPDYGLYRFPSHHLIPSEGGDLSQDARLSPIKGCDCDVDENHPINDLNGVLEIGLAPDFMVVTGKETGRVFWWDGGDMLCDVGLFDKRYQKWIDKVIDELRNT